ncbi:MAG: hypothetical protein IKK39_11290 [Thermoguttaceae bacterium]|nr:hypothetical protein [Thermoguttaceae bacterium]MBR4104631.1 hypothetical protein [Thermoguttaceae bacterium]
MPDIPTSDDGQNGEFGRDEQDGASAASASFDETEKNDSVAASGEREEESVNWEVPARRSGATIASHLTPDKERPENWRRAEAGTTSGWGGTDDEIDDASLLARTEVSDAEFLRRLRSEPQAQVVAIPPVAPPVLRSATAETQENAGVGGIPKFVWGAVGVATLGSAFVVGAFWGGGAKNNGVGDVTSVEKEVAKDSVFVEGALTYRTANGTNAPDDGAFVFLFPTDERWSAPLALGDVSPQRPNPPGFENVVAELEARGARFAVADFEGRFAFDDLAPGEYRVLLVSRRVGDDWGNANPGTLKEIERCVVGPRLLLGQSRFFWTTRRFDRDAATLEKSFGKAGAPFSNVE